MCQDNIYRYPSSENRHLAHSGRQVSEVMHYPSYLERGPDYEEEMRYYQGDTLSPKDKVKIHFQGHLPVKQQQLKKKYIHIRNKTLHIFFPNYLLYKVYDTRLPV